MLTKDRVEFNLYLENCTDAQVIGVWVKERKAKRRAYAALAKAEMDRRGITATTSEIMAMLREMHT